MAVEVRNVRTDWILTPELPLAEAAIAQPAPDGILSVSRLLPQCTCALRCVSVVFMHLTEGWLLFLVSLACLAAFAGITRFVERPLLRLRDAS